MHSERRDHGVGVIIGLILAVLVGLGAFRVGASLWRRTGLVVVSLAALAVDGLLGTAHKFEPTRKMRPNDR
jgi:hypothetical protein